eukprot:ANDGO_06906.mRNA.1 COMM domain-containing protein 7
MSFSTLRLSADDLQTVVSTCISVLSQDPTMTTAAAADSVLTLVSSSEAQQGLRILLHYFLNTALPKGLFMAEIKEDLVNCLGMTEAQSASTIQAVSLRMTDISNRFFKNALTPSGRVVDMDWRFGVTAASSESHALAGIGASYLQIKLTFENGTTQWAEMTLPQFYGLLADLERAKMELDAVAS